MQRPIDLAVIYGSTRPNRLCGTVVDWIAGEIDRAGGFTVDRVDPADPKVAAGIAGSDEIARASLRRRLGKAQAFVVVTPEYNHSFPAPLKGVIDAIKAEWQAKPMAFVSYAGISGRLRAVEQLRLVFAELHAVGIRDGVSFANAPRQFDEEGALLEPGAPRAAASLMLARLVWWAAALDAARGRQPYGEIAA